MAKFDQLDTRSREIFKVLVESYLQTGNPIGSRNITENLSQKISPATVRNVMADLEHLGLLGSPHTSAGRLPTQSGLRLFVDGILEVQDLSRDEQKLIEKNIRGNQDQHTSDLLARTGSMLSQISKSASLVFAKKQEQRIKHIDFVSLSPEQALVVLVGDDGSVENRLFTPPAGMTPSDMRRAANFMNAHAVGHSISELEKVIQNAITTQQAEVDDMMSKLIDQGQAAIIKDEGAGTLLVRGRANLVGGDQNTEELETLRQLLDDLESKRDLAELLQLSDGAQSVAVFIGSENKLFSMKGSSLVVSPYMNGEGQIIGALGVVGPTRLNYARIVPMVSYTANLIGKMIEEES